VVFWQIASLEGLESQKVKLDPVDSPENLYKRVEEMTNKATKNALEKVDTRLQRGNPKVRMMS
jgi:hypothetical protein